MAQYVKSNDGQSLDPSALAFYAGLDSVRVKTPEVAAAILKEFVDQRSNVKLIASENYCSLAVQFAQGNLFTDKYAEGFPGHRFYAGCENVDSIEDLAAGLARKLFGAEYAFVQPHSGADANLVAYTAILKQRVELPALERLNVSSPTTLDPATWNEIRHALGNQRLLGMDYSSGGHLTHGYRFNVSSWLFDAYQYTVDPQSKRLEIDSLRSQLREVRPLIFLVGYSAYPRRINFAQMRELADEVGAVLMVDMAHFAGLVAGKVFTGDFDPVAHAHVVTTTTHKTLRGPRGGMVLATSEFADAINKACPTMLGGPLPHVMAAKAVALSEALQPEFRDYARRIVVNSQALAQALKSRGVSVLTGGTDNHLVLADVFSTYGLSGRQAETALRSVGLTLNRNSLPFDVNGPWYTSGLRLGTPAITTLGMGPAEMDVIAEIITSVLANLRGHDSQKKDGTHGPGAKYDVIDSTLMQSASERIQELMSSFRVYPEIDMNVILSTQFGKDVFEERDGVIQETTPA